ncbi:R3H domain-containing protein 1-like [Oryza brachyantha]|uniref:R3H domain-containing protein n=1 Tax=Oryza brachyantha TaxID=4533 RepID=J3KVJ8_ORYBR|nr:R3H domain-containing protein 1-like [Oryza brachyantha]
MSSTQFAMVEELASLIKDNLYSKHLVLSTEETLVGVLQNQYHNSDDEDDTVAAYRRTNRNIIELQPASSYQRLLLHRLADIYGFVHESVGEGEDRHLVLQRCPETAIPPVLVSDVLWEYDNEDTSTSVVVKRKDTDIEEAWKEDAQENISAESSHLKNDADLKDLQQSAALPALSLKEREAAYQAARERIFSTHDAKGKDTAVVKPRHVPAVARRMIAHALGKKFESPTETAVVMNGKGKEPAESTRSKLNPGTTGSKEDTRYVENDRMRSHNRDQVEQSWRASNSRAASSVSTDELKREQVGAAKRIFAHALRLPGIDGSDGSVQKGRMG